MDTSAPSDTNHDTTGVVFRPAQATDLSEIVRMLADDPLGAQREAWSDPLPLGYIEAFEAIRNDPNNELVVAVIAEQLVGVLQMTFIPYLTYQGRWRALIEGVRIASHARSKGLGAAMIGWAIQRARDRNCVMVQLTTDRTRADALRFYERFGFVSSHHGLKLHLS
jgi:GNAT superfamily N-acetyltransferase